MSSIVLIYFWFNGNEHVFSIVIDCTQFLAKRKGAARCLHRDSQLFRKESAYLCCFEKEVCFDYILDERRNRSVPSETLSNLLGRDYDNSHYCKRFNYST